MATYEELMNSAEQIRTNELPESNTHELVGKHLKNQVEHFNSENQGVKGQITALNKNTGISGYPVWKPNTAYAKGVVILNPDGQLVKNTVEQLDSGGTYNPVLWETTSLDKVNREKVAELDINANSLRDILNNSFIVKSNTNLVFNGENIVESESIFKGYILEITSNISEITFSKNVQSIVGLTEYPFSGLTPSVLFGSNIKKISIDSTSEVKFILVTDSFSNSFTAECFDKRDILESGILNVTRKYPLQEGEYYTIKTAAAAIETKYRYNGLQIVFFDGKSWVKYQFIGKDLVYFLGSSYWRNIPYYPTLDGIIFKNGQDYAFGPNTKGIPIIDIITISNGGYDKIFLNALYKTETAATVQFKDENGNILCQFYRTEDVSSYTGIQTVECTPINESGVIIKVKLNWDLVSNIQSGFETGNLEIIQKNDELLELDERLISVENTLDGKLTTLFERNISSMLNVLIPIPNGSISLTTNMDDEYKDIFSSYRIFLCEDDKFTNLTLFVDNCKFGEYYDVSFTDNFKYVYVFNASEKNNGFSGSVTIINNDSFEQRIHCLENEVRYKGKTIVSLGDSLTEFTYNGKGYIEYLQQYTGGNVIRGGIGGTRLAERTTPTLSPQNTTEAYAALDIVNIVKAWTSGDWSIVDVANQYLKDNTSDDNTMIINSLKNIPISNVDIVTLFAGTNDLTGGSVLGDLNSETAGEVCGAINLIVKMLLETNQKIRIFVFTPIVRYVGSVSDENWSDVYTNSKGYTLPQLCEKITECAKQLHLPVCDMYWGLGWNKYNFSNYFLDSDQTHPYKGFDAIARKMLAFINANRNF